MLPVAEVNLQDLREMLRLTCLQLTCIFILSGFCCKAFSKKIHQSMCPTQLPVYSKGASRPAGWLRACRIEILMVFVFLQAENICSQCRLPPLLHQCDFTQNCGITSLGQRKALTRLCSFFKLCSLFLHCQ